MFIPKYRKKAIFGQIRKELGDVFRRLAGFYLDSWIRHRLRCVQWKQWKVYRRRKAELIRLGIAPDLAQSTAWSAKGPWRISHTPGVRIALNNGHFDALGLPRLDPRVSI